MMINIPHMGHIGPEILDHGSEPAPRFRRINRVACALCLSPKSALCLKVDARNRVLIVRSRLAARISHRKQGYGVTLLSQQIHQFKQVNFSAAEGMVIFVAE